MAITPKRPQPPKGLEPKKPKPAPSPTSYKQLNIDMATMANVKKEDQFTPRDPNTYSGTYKGKRYTWQSGGFLK
jgi:hypothetical protein